MSFHSPNWRLGESNLRNLSGTKQVHNEAGKNGGFLGGWGGGVGWSPLKKNWRLVGVFFFGGGGWSGGVEM